ncbi:MAG: DUF4386 domain-containing protein [Deltaproteobacteria bacterium]|nr:DUF4386 domain-containing protein [Deltaproteobacteria bacterium]MBT4641876.1 DUF4386 domain-containing protein [Deltaproteobacteria bacterium]MBT6503358.1 DUF4386 domain-containing protein [Deltaproteobacteria bacterium]MBT6613235.1 DUF4386 domain-containing protein [Deltaproteobacteria bacterium]MBT7711022.1 DUF4386 domain-containing protein [Deltaproteobacteria bacterium]
MNSNKTTHHNVGPSPTVYARVAGILYLLMVPLGFFGYMYVPSLIVSGDPVKTASNIITSGSLFRLSIVSALTVQVVNIVLVLVLYRLLKPVNKNHALFMVIFLLVGTPIAMFDQINLFAVLRLLSGADYLTGLTTKQLHAQMMLFLDLHRQGAYIAGIFFGLWLFPMGYLVFMSGFLPRVLGILLIIGCFGYLIDSFGIFLFPSFKEIVLFTFWGEVLFPIWLLIKGVNVEQWEKLALKSE